MRGCERRCERCGRGDEGGEERRVCLCRGGMSAMHTLIVVFAVSHSTSGCLSVQIHSQPSHSTCFPEARCQHICDPHFFCKLRWRRHSSEHASGTDTFSALPRRVLGIVAHIFRMWWDWLARSKTLPFERTTSAISSCTANCGGEATRVNTLVAPTRSLP